MAMLYDGQGSTMTGFQEDRQKEASDHGSADIKNFVVKLASAR